MTDVAQTLVLAIGNRLLQDDAVGLELLGITEQLFPDSVTIEFVDGGTVGLGLLGYLDDRKRVIILDAVSLGDKPGTIHVLSADEVMNISPGEKCPTAHGSGAAELLRAATLLGSLPDDVSIVGIEPETVRTGIGLSDAVQRSLEEASIRIRSLLDESR